MRGDVNLDHGERAGRLRAALVMLGMAIVLVIFLAEMSVGLPFWFLLGAPLFVISFLIVQAYTGVCPSHASNGTRASAVGGTEPVLDPQLVCSLQARGRAVIRSSMLLAVIATSVVILAAAVR